HGKAAFEAWLAARGDQALPGFLVAIGGDRGQDRLELTDYLEGLGLTPLGARHPTAFIAGSAAVGPACQVLAQAAVCVEASLGRGTIVNTGASVDHECRIGEGVHLCPGARL